MEVKEKRTFLKLGYSPMDTAETVQRLNKLLVNYSVFYQKLRNFHWNVKGPDFFDLHEKFEEQYNIAAENIDEIAERIRVFGQTPISTLKEYLENSEIKESKSDLTGFQMVNKVLEDFRTLLDILHECIESAEEIGDVGTEIMAKSYVKQIEKDHWILTTWLK